MNKLYKKTAKGQTQTWEIEVEGARFRTHEGILNGQITTSAWTTCEGKNPGKANATTGEEQAAKEALAKWTKKKDSYHESLKDIEGAKFFNPMLAHKYEDHEIEFPVYSQPKLDGMRCLATKDGLFSRNGKPILSAPHILFAVQEIFETTHLEVLDGELYCHKLKTDFNKIISLAKKTKPTDEDLKESAKHLEYHVYDYYSPDSDFQNRTDYLHHTIFKLELMKKGIIPVQTSPIYDLEELDEIYFDYLAAGYEGQMVRSSDGLYENKRSKNLLKRKTMIEEEFELVDLQPGKGNLEDMVARAILKTKEGKEFEAGMYGSHEFCRRLLKEKDQVIGRQGTVVFQNYTPEGKPRFGKLKAIRDYE